MEVTELEEWSSLDKAKLGISFLVPVIILCIGFWFGYIESERANNSRVAELKFEKYEILGKEVNSIFSYLYYVGNWKEMSPVEVLQSKRTADTIFYTYESMFSDEFKAVYHEFMKVSFKTRNGWGKDAKIKSNFKHRMDLYSFLVNGKEGEQTKVNWNRDWEVLFDSNYKTRSVSLDSEDGLIHGTPQKHGNDLVQAYNSFKKQIAIELKF